VGLLDSYEHRLRALKQLIQAGDGPGLEKELDRAKQVREKL